MLPVTALGFRNAARLADQNASGIRAGDALQLVVASRQGTMLATLDRRRASAATALGVSAQLL